MGYIFDLHNKMLQNNLILAYEGKFSQILIDSVLRITDEKFEKLGETKKVKKLVSHVMIECLQNICIHADPINLKSIEDTSVLIIGMDGNRYTIITGNLIRNNKKTQLIAFLEKLNNSTPQEINELFTSALTNIEFSEKGTAGLGLITILKKTGNKLSYSFSEVNNDFSFFTLLTKIPRKNN